MKINKLMIASILGLIGPISNLEAGNPRVGIEVQSGPDYYYDDEVWIGPGWYYGVWFDDEIYYRNWYRSHNHHYRGHRGPHHGGHHGGHGGRHR